jgi:hypothetical protein
MQSMKKDQKIIDDFLKLAIRVYKSLDQIPSPLGKRAFFTDYMEVLRYEFLTLLERDDEKE